MSFRIAIGGCDCRQPYKDPIQRKVCEVIEARLHTWRGRLPADLGAVPTEEIEDLELDGHRVTFATQKHALESGAVIIVFQALVHTWSRPIYLSVGAVGRMYSDGLLVSADGTVQPAADELMWEYR